MPTSRPGIWRTSASVEARIPRYGPPYCGAIPSGWPSPAAMSAPYAPGGARTARLTGSMTATNSAPAACASSPIAGIGSSRPRKLGWAAITPATGRSGSASSRSSASRSVVPGGVAVGHQRDLLELEAAPEVGPEGLPVVRMDAARDEDPVAPRRAAGHQRRLGGRRGAVVVRRRHDVEIDELGRSAISYS